jgi:hypothetical protein
MDLKRQKIFSVVAFSHDRKIFCRSKVEMTEKKISCRFKFGTTEKKNFCRSKFGMTENFKKLLIFF